MGWGVWGKSKWEEEEEELSDWRRRRRSRRRRRRRKKKIGRYPMGLTKTHPHSPQFGQLVQICPEVKNILCILIYIT